MFKRTKQLIKANTLLKEELVSLEKEYDENEREIENMNKLLVEMNMGYMQCLTVEDKEGSLSDLTLEYANDAITNNSRLTGKTLLGQPLSKIFPSLFKNLLKVCSEAMTSGNRTSFIHYDEVEDHYIKVICYKVAEKQCVCALLDITDSFYEEKLLTEREEQYRSIFDVTDLYFFELDLDGRFYYISEGIRKMLGFEPEDYLGRYYYEQYPLDVRTHTAHMFQKCFQECGQEIHGLMTKLIGKDGREHYAIQNGIVLMDEDGNDVGYRGVYLDITKVQKEKKKAEDEVERKTEILTKMSREIRNPLNGMIGLTSLALEEPRTYKVYRYLQKIEENAVDLLDVINSVLDYSQIAEDEIRLYEEAFSLQLVIQKVTSLLTTKAQEKRIKLIVEMEENVPDTYSGDSIRLEQILTNLISSAIKYTLEGYVKLIIRKRDKGILFIIKDTGVGMSREEMKHIFSTDQREEGTVTGRKNGTCLLMLISKQLIEAMDGRIKVFSKEREGTKVYVALPLKQCEEDLVRSTERAFHRQRRIPHYEGNVLVVEDRSTSQIVVCDQLAKFGINVTVAENGKEAIKLAREKSFDIIFMDVFLPKLSGFEVCKRMRKEKVSIPIIAMTANPFETIRQEFEKAEMDDYLIKPINFYKMEYILQKYLEMDSYEPYIACTLEEKKEECVYPFGHINYAKAMEQLDHDYNLYNKIVFSFIKEYQEDISHFKELASSDRKAARNYIQTMKGAAGALGATELSALAGQLEDMLLDGNVDKGLVGLYASELSAVLSELIPYAESITMERHTKGFLSEKAGELLREISDQVESHSAAAVDMVARIYETLYRKDLAEYVESLVSQIEEYDFEKAEKTLATIQESLGVKL